MFNALFSTKTVVEPAIMDKKVKMAHCSTCMKQFVSFELTESESSWHFLCRKCYRKAWRRWLSERAEQAS
jgi:hypothetical protein